MISKPLIYCCIPRAGIMFMTFLYGLSDCFNLIIRVLLSILPEEQSASIAAFFGAEDATWFGYLLLLAESVLGFAYFYICYLVYKRRYKPIMTVLYVVMLDVLWDLYQLVAVCIFFYNLPPEQKRLPTFEMWQPASAKQNATIADTAIRYSGTVDVVTGFAILFTITVGILLLLNKIYVIFKIRAYVRYVEYKRNEAISSTYTEPSSASRHPETERLLKPNDD